MSTRTVRLYVPRDSAVHTTWKRQRGGPLAGLRVCVCSALSGSLMHRVRCIIYEERPDVCREFVPGGPACLAAREDVCEVLAVV